MHATQFVSACNLIVISRYAPSLRRLEQLRIQLGVGTCQSSDRDRLVRPNDELASYRSMSKQLK